MWFHAARRGRWYCLAKALRGAGLVVFLLAVVAASVLADRRAEAQTWSGTTSGTWSVVGAGGNWSNSASYPGSTSGTTNGNTALFNNAGNTFTTIYLDNTYNVGNFTFDTAAAAYTIGGVTSPGGPSTAGAGNSLLLTNNGTIQLTSGLVGSGLTELFNAPIVLEPSSGTAAGAYTFTNNSSTALNDILDFAGPISGGTTTNTVTLNLNGTSGSGNIISGAISNGAASSVAVTLNNSGTWTFSGANTYTGATTITNGTLDVSGSLGATTVNLNNSTSQLNVLSGSLTGSTVNVNSGGFALDGSLTNTAVKVVNGTFIETAASTIGGSSSLYFINPNATVTLQGTNTYTGSTTVAAGTLILSTPLASSAVIVDSGATLTLPAANAITGASSLTTNGGSITFSYSNNYTGATSLLGGSMYLNIPNAIPAGPTLTIGVNSNYGVDLDNSSGAPVTLTSNNAITVASRVSFGGTNSLDMGSGAVNLNGSDTFTLIGNNSNTLSFDGQVSSSTGAVTTTVNNLAGVVGETLNFGSFSVAGNVDSFNGSGNLNIANGVTGTSGGLTYSGSGVMSISGASSYSGTTQLTGAGTLIFNSPLTSGAVTASNGVFYTSSSASITAPSLTESGGAGMVLNAANTISTSTTLSGGTLFLNNAGALGGGGTLTISGGTVDNTSGPINNPVANAIVLSSANALTISNNFNFGGSGSLTIPDAFTIPAKTVTLNAANANTLTLGGAMTLSGNTTLSVNNGTGYAGETLVLSGNETPTTNAITFGVNGSGNVTISGGLESISGTSTNSAFTYSGTGTLVMSGASNNGGSTQFNNGTTILTGSLGNLYPSSLSSGGAAVYDQNSIFNETGTGSILNASTFTVQNFGAVATLSGANSYTGATTVNYAQLNLDFSQSGAPTTNILYNGVTAATFNMTDGVVNIIGAPGGANSQAFGTVALGSNTSSTISLIQNGATSIALNFAGLTRNTQTTLDFTIPSADTVTTTAVADTTNGILTNGANGAAFVTFGGGATWATNTSGTIGGLASYATGVANYTATNNIDVTGGDAPAASSTVNSLRFDSLAAGGTLTLSGAANIIGTGGILVTANTLGNAATITGGSIAPGTGGKEIVVIDYGALNIASNIVNNGSNATALTIAGPGLTTLSGANTYTGATSVDAGAALVLSGSMTNNGSTTVYTSATFIETTTGSISAGNITENGNYSQLVLNGANTTTGNVTADSGDMQLTNLATNVQNATLQLNGGTVQLMADSSSMLVDAATQLTNNATVDVGHFTAGNTGNTLTIPSIVQTGAARARSRF